ncbi:UNVERIFIED_CONTAM: hypothetical protein Slati_3805800 [Sesamum latifolium]|uniref:Uncharacterized protein n=1 Tax=Sesamum latifolium TaxID=2727402 RepID=A0AAW2U454_9LAMI
MEDTPFIQFGRAKQSGPKISHGDALVIPVSLANYEVGRIFIDWKLRRHTLWTSIRSNAARGHPLEKVNASLYGFAGEVVHHRGMIPFPLTLGTGVTQRTCMLKFLVVDVLSAYNVILGRPTFNASKQ